MGKTVVASGVAAVVEWGGYALHAFTPTTHRYGVPHGWDGEGTALNHFLPAGSLNVDGQGTLLTDGMVWVLFR